MSGSLKICVATNEVQTILKEFRLKKSSNTSAVSFKIEKDKQLIVLDEQYEDCCIDDLRAELPDSEPRFVLISYRLNHSDGRVSYPLCMLFYSPAGCNPEMQMMYAGSKNNLYQQSGATKDFEIRDLDELTDEFMEEKLVK